VTDARPARSAHRERFVSASELAEYAYCRRAWWLRAVRGAKSPEQGARFDEGRAAHERHALGILAARALAITALALLIAAVVLWLMRAR
jgi:CRISPR/Cas system-associated exonuclease Cas4 (RecB family)